MSRSSSCDVCEWATPEVQAFDMNLCVDCEETMGLAAKAERERIITLLNESGDLALTQIQDGQWVYSIAELIALIKGDNK